MQRKQNQENNYFWNMKFAHDKDIYQISKILEIHPPNPNSCKVKKKNHQVIAYIFLQVLQVIGT